MKKILLSILLLLPLFAISQNLTCLGNSKVAGGNGYDGILDAIPTADSGYVITGFTTSTDVPGYHSSADNYNDVYVAKFDKNDNLEWQKAFGGTYSEMGRRILELSDGYVIAGFTESSDGDVLSGTIGARDWWIIKVSKTGALLWETTFGSSGSNYDGAFDLDTTDNGNLLVVGYAFAGGENTTTNYGYADILLLEINPANGNIISQHNYGGSSTELGNDIMKTSDGGYLICGYTMSDDNDVTSGNEGLTDIWVIKLNSDFSIQWEKTIGSSDEEWAHSAIEDNEGNFYIAGFSSGNDGDIPGNYGYKDFLIAKLSASGQLLWVEHFGGSNFDEAQRIIFMPDSNLLALGYSYSHDYDVTGHHNVVGDPQYEFTDAWIVILDRNGEKLATFSPGSSDDDGFEAAFYNYDGRLYFAGWTEYYDGDVDNTISGPEDGWLINLDFYDFLNPLPDTVKLCEGNNLKLSAFIKNADQTFSYQWFKNEEELNGQTDSVLYIENVNPGNSGVYYCIVTNNCGEDTTNFSNVIVGEIPETVDISGPVNVDLYETATYSVPQNDQVIYHWTVEKGNIINQPSNNAIEVNWTEEGQGKISVVAEDKNAGCLGDTSFLYVNIGNSLITAENEISLYPVPVVSYLYIKGMKQNSLVIITDMTGNKVYERKASGSIKIDMSVFSDGLYLVSIINQDKKTVFKVPLFK